MSEMWLTREQAASKLGVAIAGDQTMWVTKRELVAAGAKEELLSGYRDHDWVRDDDVVVGEIIVGLRILVGDDFFTVRNNDYGMIPLYFPMNPYISTKYFCTFKWDPDVESKYLYIEYENLLDLLPGSTTSLQFTGYSDLSKEIIYYSTYMHSWEVVSISTDTITLLFTGYSDQEPLGLYIEFR